MTNYDEKIKQLNQAINRDYEGLVKILAEIVNSYNHTTSDTGISMSINKEEADLIDQQINLIKENINSFNYYTTFYPAKDKVWSKEIFTINHIFNVINEISIGDKIGE